MERIWDIAQRYTLPGSTEGVRYLAAALGDDSGIVGCAAFAKSKLRNSSIPSSETNSTPEPDPAHTEYV